MSLSLFLNWKLVVYFILKKLGVRLFIGQRRVLSEQARKPHTTPTPDHAPTPCHACPTVVLRIQVRSFVYVANLSSIGPTWGIRDGPRGYSVYLENGSLASLTGKVFEYLSVVQVD